MINIRKQGHPYRDEDDHLVFVQNTTPTKRLPSTVKARTGGHLPPEKRAQPAEPARA